MIKKWNAKQTNWNINGDKMKCFQGVIKKKTKKKWLLKMTPTKMMIILMTDDD
jgi:hypothetical protein